MMEDRTTSLRLPKVLRHDIEQLGHFSANAKALMIIGLHSCHMLNNPSYRHEINRLLVEVSDQYVQGLLTHISNAWAAVWDEQIGQMVDIPATDWVSLCRRYGYICLACRQSRKLTVDHVIPVSKGGASTIDNIQPLCHGCNSKKADQYTDYRPFYHTKSPYDVGFEF